ncbi:MAG TPA: hypothetical protein VFK16_00535 [Gemmatimonadaceae bacterium]|jgi:hypothetical protein|nr:hypothetical protein [Gemmatimonadaceae bacterium]
MQLNDLIAAILVFTFSVICVGSLTKITLAFLNRKASKAMLPPDLDERLSRIEQIVETTAVEVERVSEAQRFTAKVLAERSAPGGLPASHAHGRVNTPH